VLLIAKLDRLARNVAFIANLMESGVDFIACDMPQATRLTIHILAAVAEHEREAISQRTKTALAEAERRGKKLGNPRIQESIAKARAAKGDMTPAPEVRSLLATLRSQGKGLREIAREMNRLSIRSPLGAHWHAAPLASSSRQPRRNPPGLASWFLPRCIWGGGVGYRAHLTKGA
jgi:hypothetical protein